MGGGNRDPRPGIRRPQLSARARFRLPTENRRDARPLLWPHAVAVNDRTIELGSESFLDAYLTFRALANFTALAPMATMFNSLREVGGGNEVYRRIREHLSDLPPPGFEPAGNEIDMNASAKGRHGYR